MADSVIKYSDLIGEDDTFEIIFANIDKLKSELEDLAKITKKDLEFVNPNEEKKVQKLVKEVEVLAKLQDQINKEEKAAIKTKKKLNDLTEDELIQREKQKILNRERVQRAKQLAILRNKETGEIEKLRAKLSLTTLEWKKLSKEELKNGKEGKRLIKEKKRLTDQLKRLEKQTGDTRRNVGNYTSALGKMGRTASRIFVGRSIVQGIMRVGRAFKEVFDENKEGNEQFENFERLIGGVVSKLKGIAVTILDFIIPIVTKGVRMFGFFSAKISESATEGSFLASAFDFVGKAVTFVISTIQDLPIIFSGVVAGAKALATQVGESFSNLGKRVKILFLTIEKVNPFSNRNKAQINRNIKQIQDQINRTNKSSVGAAQAYRETVSRLRKEFEDYSLAQEEEEKKQAARDKKESTREERRKARDERRKKAIADQNKLLQLQIKLQANTDARIEAIVSLQEKITKAETNAVEDKTKRLLSLEGLKFKEIQKKREKDFMAFLELQEQQEETLIAFYGENSDKVIAFRDEAAKQALQAEALNLKLSEIQLQESEDRKLKIIQDAEKKRIAEVTKTVRQAQALIKKGQKEEDEFLKKSREEAAKSAAEVDRQEQKRIDKIAKDKQARAKKEKELIEGIFQTAELVGAKIVEIFDKQSEAAISLVKKQSDAVETQRKRAEDGLSNTLAFEQQQLAAREAERIRAEKKAEQAAKLLTLFNLVSAYAQSGDTNALARGLVDFSLLEALSSGFQEFEEGGYTGDVGRSEVAGRVHGQEYVVTAEDTAKYGLVGKGGSDFGESMSDYFNYNNPLNHNLFAKQNDSFLSNVPRGTSSNFNGLEREVRAMRKAIEKMPQNDFDILQITDYFVEISKRVTSNRMTSINKARKRL